VKIVPETSSRKNSVYYVVRPNDTLSSIAKETLQAADRWQEIAKANRISGTDVLLIGQRLLMPEPVHQTFSLNPVLMQASNPTKPLQDRPATVFPARVHLFILADELNPLSRKVVRKVILPPKGVTSPSDIARISHPEQFGFQPIDPTSNVGLGRHVGGRTDSRFISASDRALGSPRLSGKRFFIDVKKAQAAGVRIHETAEIIADFDKLIAKTRQPAQQTKFKWIRDQSLHVDQEVLLEGSIPAAAVKTSSMMAITRGAQVLTGVGVVITAYDLEQAGQRSYQQHSIKPLATETVRQVGGWSGAWAGMEIGGGLGAAAGIEMGPGALVTGLVGSLIGGYAGFTGADWAARWIEH
jgi:LysM repeat protein